MVGAVTFIREMAWTVPRGIEFYMNDTRYRSGDKVIINLRNADYLLNTSLVAGPSIKGNISGDFGFVLDFGLATNIDLANWRQRFQVPLLASILTYVVSGSALTQITSYLELSTVNIGIGFNAGLQYRMGGSNFGPLIFEAGVNLGYYFGKFNVYEAGFIPHFADGTSGEKVVLGEGSGAYEMVNIVRIGSPYIVFGWTF